MSHIEIQTNEATKCVGVWLTSAEAEDPVIQAQLRQLFGKCTEKRYLPAVFISGREDLADLTSQLLVYNRLRCMDPPAQDNMG